MTAIHPPGLRRRAGLRLALLLALPLAVQSQPPAPEPRYQALQVQAHGDAGTLQVLASGPLGSGSSTVTTAVIALHGHSRDALRSFQATTAAAAAAGQSASTLVVAPLFQVADTTRCHSPGLPAPQAGDLLWTCSTWQQGASAKNAPGITANQAIDTLVGHLLQHHPALHTITIAGFSAGGQMVQRYVGFAATPSRPVHLRYVVGSPSSWLYFDPERPLPTRQGQPDQAVEWATCSTGAPAQAGTCGFTFALPDAGACPHYHRWKFGTEHWPATYGRSAEAARAAYVAADVTYLLGAQDTGTAQGAGYSILDKTCPAQLQGPFRLQRGLAYAAYDAAKLAGGRHRLVPPAEGCGHDVRCVFPSASGQAALFPAAK